MNIETKISSEINISFECYKHEGELKTHPCERHAWYGNETCDYVKIDEKLQEINVPDGEYEVIISLKRIGD